MNKQSLSTTVQMGGEIYAYSSEKKSGFGLKLLYNDGKR